MFKITLDDLDTQRVFGKLVTAGANLRPLMKAIGEGLQQSTKDRFASGTAPDGSRWLPNSTVTVARFLTKQSGNFGKNGKITKKGAERAGNKRPLIGISKDLGRSINYVVSDTGVDIGPPSIFSGSPMIYASTQQFGAKARSFKGGKSPWGDIPARPFLGLSTDDEQIIRDATADFIDALLA